jgi:hypothetical protein
MLHVKGIKEPSSLPAAPSLLSGYLYCLISGTCLCTLNRSCCLSWAVQLGADLQVPNNRQVVLGIWILKNQLQGAPSHRINPHAASILLPLGGPLQTFCADVETQQTTQV